MWVVEDFLLFVVSNSVVWVGDFLVVGFFVLLWYFGVGVFVVGLDCVG